ncbi:hypothetical protein Q7P37_009615 [Cladosporium fusiforme]
MAEPPGPSTDTGQEQSAVFAMEIATQFPADAADHELSDHRTQNNAGNNIAILTPNIPTEQVITSLDELTLSPSGISLATMPTAHMMQHKLGGHHAPNSSSNDIAAPTLGITLEQAITTSSDNMTESLDIEKSDSSVQASASSQSRAHRVFGTTELLENILQRLSGTDLLLRVQLTCREFKDAMEASMAIRQITSTAIYLEDQTEQWKVEHSEKGESLFIWNLRPNNMSWHDLCCPPIENLSWYDDFGSQTDNMVSGGYIKI